MIKSTANVPVQIPVWDTITTAWEKVSGSKGTFWAAFGVLILISIAFGILEGLTKDSVPVLYGIICFIGNVVGFFLQFGVLYIGIRRAQNLPIEWQMVFRVVTDLKMALWIVVAYILMMLVYIPAGIIAVIGLVLMPIAMPLAVLFFIASVIAFLILAMRLILTVGLILDKEMTAIDAIKASFRATRSNTLNLFAIFILQIIIVTISAIPLGIGLIWTIPLAMIIYGLMYQRLLPNA